MKVCFVIGTLYFSGAEKIARYLIDALKTRGHDVGLILLSRAEPYDDLKGINQFPVLQSGNRFIRFIKRHKAIRNVVEKENFDVVVSFGSNCNIDTMEALSGVKTPVIVCERNDPINDPKGWFLRFRRHMAYTKASGYVFQTEQIADFFGKTIKEKAAIIPNFIETSYENVYDAESDNNILLTARLDDNQKNISMLLRAFKRFSKSFDYKLYIVGDGPDKSKFETFIKNNDLADRVIMPGKCDVHEYLKKSQIYVLPSNFEGMPNSLIEALASGLPTIATDCSGGGAAALIQNRINGILIPVGDENALYNALCELADKPELRLALSAEAHKINDLLEFNSIIDRWIRYIEFVSSKQES